MELHERLNNDYKAYCESQKKHLDEAGRQYRESGDEWECVKSKIKLGLAEMIFSSVATIYDLADDKATIPEKHWLRREVDLNGIRGKNERFYRFLTAFMDHVKAPWLASLEQSKERDDAETIDKETVKLEYLQELKDRFTSMYTRLSEDFPC